MGSTLRLAGSIKAGGDGAQPSEPQPSQAQPGETAPGRDSGPEENFTQHELDAEEKTQVVPSIFGADTQILYRLESETVVMVALPAPSPQGRTQQSPQAKGTIPAPSSGQVGPFIEADIDKALSPLSEPEPARAADVEVGASGEILRDQGPAAPTLEPRSEWVGAQRVELFGEHALQRSNAPFLRDEPYGPARFDSPVLSESFVQRVSYATDPSRAPTRKQSSYSLLPVTPPPLLAPPPSSLADYWAAIDPGAVYGPGSYSAIGTPPGPYAQMAGPVAQMMAPYSSYTGPAPYFVQQVLSKPASGLRWAVVLILAIATAGLGLGAGWLLFAAESAGEDDVRASAPLPKEASTPPHAAAMPPAPAAPAAPAAAAPAATAPAPDAEPVVVDIASLQHPALPPLTSPHRGQLTLSALPSARRVAKGEKLFEIKRKVSSDGRSELAARVAELKLLAREDPVYEAFLARAREAYRRAQRSESISVRAESDALAEPLAERNDRVEQGQKLAEMTDPGMWTARASLRRGDVTPEWRCGIASADNSYRAACRIEQVVVNQPVAEVTASVEAAQVPWLRNLEQRPRLILEPPAAR